MSDYRKHLYDPYSIEAKISLGVISFVGIVAILASIAYFDMLTGSSTRRETLRITNAVQVLLRDRFEPEQVPLLRRGLFLWLR